MNRSKDSEIISSLVQDAFLTEGEALKYLEILKKGFEEIKDDKDLLSLHQKGMIIISSDNKKYIPTHPRLAVSNQYRVWREKVVNEINERRKRIDRLILLLIQMYEKKGGSP